MRMVKSPFGPPYSVVFGFIVSIGFRPYLTMSHKSSMYSIEILIVSQSNVSGGCSLRRHPPDDARDTIAI